MGRSEHQRRQDSLRRAHPDFKGEYQVSHEFNFSGFHIVLRGRPDAVYREGDYTVVEEIKTIAVTETAFGRYTLDSLGNFTAQLNLYSCLLYLQGIKPLLARLYLVNLTGGEERILDYQPDLNRIAQDLEKALSRIIADAERKRQHHLGLSSEAEGLQFPYPHFRPHQKKMMDEVAAAIETGGRLMLSAPTGSGKTAGVLFPALVSAFKLGRKVFFATARTTQRHIVRDFVYHLKERDAPFSTLFMTARAKMCPLGDEVCSWSDCPYLAGFEDKFNRTSLMQELNEGAVFDGEDISQRVLPLKICPFAVSLELSAQADLVVGDFNYVFDPSVSLKRLFAEGGASDFALIVDEAHNLPDRVRGYYSPELAAGEVELLLAGLRMKSHYGSLLKELASFFRLVLKLIHRHTIEAGEVELKRGELSTLHSTAEKLMMYYYLHLAEHDNVQPEEPVLEFLRGFSKFCRVAEMGPEGFAVISVPDERRVKILCLHPGLRLAEIMASFGAVIAMSATLHPTEFFLNMLGLEGGTETLTLPNPFPAENRYVGIVADVSTRYKVRDRFVKHIAEHIDRIYDLHPGGYFCFFPSFAYMESAARHLKSPHILQQSGMTEASREAFLREVKTGGKLFLAVMGGIFAEGVYYPGQLEGVMVIGPGLPQYCLENELQRLYFDEVYGQGFEYSYVYPGMNRVIQAAGRLIRGETDRGVIILMDARFTQEPYRSLLPRDWYVEHPSELVVEDLEGELERFWV